MRIENLEEKFNENGANGNFSLILDGLGLVFGKKDEWRVWFPTAWDHTLEVSIYRETGKGWEIIKKPLKVEVGSVISIKHKGADEFSEEPDFGGEIFDISEFHKHLKLKKNKELKKNGILLRLKDTKLSPLKTTKRNFKIWKYSKDEQGTAKPPELSGQRDFAVAVGGTIEIKGDDAETELKIKENSDFNKKLEYTKNGNEKYIVKISNHCHRQACDYQSDFDLYYKLIDDKSLENVEYNLEYIDKGDKGARAPCNIICSSFDPEV